MSARAAGLGVMLLVAACATGPTGTQETSSPAAELVARADAQLAASDFEQAIATYRRAIEQYPDFGHAHSRLSFAMLFSPAAQPQAIEEARTATELAPDSGEAWAYLARALDWNGDFEEALDAAREGESLEPDNADVQSFLAEVLADLRMYDEALEAAERAVELDPANAEARRNLGYVYEFVGRGEEALTEYTTALDLERDFVYRHTSLAGYYLYEADDQTAGERWLDSAYQLAPHDYITLLLLSRIHSGRGELDQAIEYCEQILEQAPEAADGHDCLAGAYLDAGRYSEAEAERKAAIEAEPDSESGYLGLGFVYYAQRACQSALVEFSKAVEIHPRTGSNHAAVGFAHACLGDFDQAEAAYQRAIELEPQEGDHHILLGRMYLESGDPDRAKREFGRAVDLDPDNDQYVAWLGRLHSAQGELEPAVAEYERAAAMDPDDPSHELSLGFTYLNLGSDPEQAARHFERAQGLYREQGATARESAQAYFGLALVDLAGADCGAAIPNLQEAVRLDPALTTASDYLLQCRRVAGYSDVTLPPDLTQRSPYAGRDTLEALRQGLAAVGVEAQAEFRPAEAQERMLLLAYVAVGDPGTPEFEAQRSLVTFAGSQVTARLLVPAVDRLLVISLTPAGDTVGLLNIRAVDARWWDLGVLPDTQFAALWETINP